MEKNFQLSQSNRIEKITPIRQKLLESGLKRDTSASLRPNKNIPKFKSNFANQKSLSLERLMIKPIKTLSYIPSPIQLRDLSTKSKKESNEEKEQVKVNKPKNINLADILKKLQNFIQKGKVCSKEIFRHAKDLLSIDENKEKIEELVKEINNTQIGNPLSVNAKQIINELVRNKPNLNKKLDAVVKNAKEVCKLSQIINKFTVRSFSDFKIDYNDLNLYTSFLILIGNTEKISLKPDLIIESMKKIVSNPGLLVQKIKKLPKLLNESLIDQEILVKSSNFFNNFNESLKSESKNLIIELLREIFTNYTTQDSDLLKNKKNLSASSSLKKQKNLKKIFLPLKLSLEKKDLEKIQTTTQNAEKIEIETKTKEKVLEKNIENKENKIFHAPTCDSDNFSSRTLEILQIGNNDPDYEYKINRNCKNILLDQFLKKNSRSET